MPLYTIQRKHIPLAEELSHNDEATVYRVQDNNMFLVKHYHAPDAEREHKITWMVDNQPYDPNQTCGHSSIAWPRWLVFNERGDWEGYVLDYTRFSRGLREVFSPAFRASNSFDLRYLYRSARYLASSMHAIHEQQGTVVGNLNPDDILVTPSSRITIVAVDSCQVEEQRDGQLVRHAARSGTPGYMPPEYDPAHAAHLTPQHDLFALGVIIYQLLMDGTHPFDPNGQWQGAGEPPPTLAARIQQGQFVESPTLPPLLLEMMRRCFGDAQQRPLAEEWEQAIEQAEQDLQFCTAGHAYATHQQACPICGAPAADRKAARHFLAQSPEPAPMCPPPFETTPPVKAAWFWPVVASVVLLIVAVLLIGGRYMMVAGA